MDPVTDLMMQLRASPPSAPLSPMSANVECLNHGCQLQRALAAVKQASQMQEAARSMLETAGRDNMSRALWCDGGGHAFSERDPGRQRIIIQVLDDDGNEVEDFREFCGECADKAGLLKHKVTRPKSPSPHVALAMRNAELEEELGIGAKDRA